VFRLKPRTNRGAYQYGGLRGNLGTSGVPGAPSVPLISEADNLGQAVLSCWTPPEHARGFVIMQMSFRRDGSLFGRPIPKQIDVSGDANARDIFVSAAASAVERCAPLKLSPEVGEAIAGQPLLFQFDAP
jgi:hypothetical protein